MKFIRFLQFVRSHSNTRDSAVTDPKGNSRNAAVVRARIEVGYLLSSSADQTSTPLVSEKWERRRFNANENLLIDRAVVTNVAGNYLESESTFRRDFPVSDSTSGIKENICMNDVTPVVHQHLVLSTSLIPFSF